MTPHFDMNQEINTYIEKHYQRWMDYTEYHCSIAGMVDESADVLDEVILALLQKDEDKVLSLMHAKDGKYTQLDYFVLRMIKLNVHSATSPYQTHCRGIHADLNIDLGRVHIEDLQEESEDIPWMILERFDTVRKTLESLNLSPAAERIFEYKFFQDQPFSRWPGPENKKQVYKVYLQVVRLIRAKLAGRKLL